MENESSEKRAQLSQHVGPKYSMEDFSCAVVGVVRNCGGTLKLEVERLWRALDGFSSVRWFLVESDSSDESEMVLRQLGATVPDFEFVSLGNLRDSMAERTTRLAYCRNHYLEKIESSADFAQVDYVVVADMDGVNSRVTREAVETCWLRDDWDACFPNQSGPYYDVWALRHGLWSPNDCWEVKEFLDSVRKKPLKNGFTAVYSRMLRISPRSEWIRVESAFGGLGVYRREALTGVRYSGRRPDGKAVCEHVPLNLQLSKRGRRLFINPRFINAGFTEHTWRYFTLVRALGKAVKRILKMGQRFMGGRSAPDRSGAVVAR